TAKNRASAATARPDKFMYVEGFTTRTSPAFAIKPANLDSAAKVAPRIEATSSANQNPALCRVFEYSRPGLPSPATKRMGVSMMSLRVPAATKKARINPRAFLAMQSMECLLLLVVLLAFLLFR